jgi:hypothetical protein
MYVHILFNFSLQTKPMLITMLPYLDILKYLLQVFFDR